MMNINQLRYFVAVADSRSFTKAAEQFFISQTAITLQIKELEAEIGIQLIDRSTRPISLTPPGVAYLSEIRGVLRRLDEAGTIAQNAASGLAGTLRIGYTNGYERSHLTDSMQRFHRLFPEVLLTCARRTTDVLAAGLVADRFDLIFTWDSTNLSRNPGFASHPVEDVPLVVALYSSHPLAKRSILSRQDLRNERILYMSPSDSENSYGDAHYMELYERAGFAPNILYRSTDTESILVMVAAEQGISIVPDFFTRQSIYPEKLRFVPLRGKDEVEPISAIWKEPVTNPLLRQFLAVMGE